mgnify:CR=1 FL=1
MYYVFYHGERSNVYTNAESLYTQIHICLQHGKSLNEILNLYKHNNADNCVEYDMTTNNYPLLDTSTTTLNADIIGALKEAEVGEIIKVETDNMIAVGATADLNEDPTDFEYVKSTICHALKDEEFENMLLETASDESFEVNQKAVDRYAPSKLKMD